MARSPKVGSKAARARLCRISAPQTRAPTGLIPVYADVPDLDVVFVGEPDRFSPIGAKGLGEVGIVGVSAAIANAVYHATGRRIHSLPITLDKLL